MRSLVEEFFDYNIGTVSSVSKNSIEVVIDINAPESLALNAGFPDVFPRINGYLLIPVNNYFLVGQITLITAHDSPFPKRYGMRDFGLIDLPFPLRKLRLIPVGTLQALSNSNIEFQSGVTSLPTIGELVKLPSTKQLKAIIESGKNKFVEIGSSMLFEDTAIFVDPDRLFGRHLAILGNTGSGKSCSVSGLIRWCLEYAGQTISSESSENSKMKVKTNLPNARFIVIDPSGEYSKAFQNNGANIKATVFSANNADGVSELQVPLWLWNSNEWKVFAQATPGAQEPLLRKALREVKAKNSGKSPELMSEDAPVCFKGEELINMMEHLIDKDNIRKDYVNSMVFRIKTFLSDPRISAIIENSNEITLNEWLDQYLGNSESGASNIFVVDLSFVPIEIVHVIIAVMARLIFEALRKYLKENKVTLPTTIVLEEAQTLINRHNLSSDKIDTETSCRNIFEKIAREGRKFGVSLVISSQRPSELSQAVLSQCNTFLLHRIANERDQDIIARLIPDSFRGVLDELPFMPSQVAILLGWATDLPVIVKINDLPYHHQPRSEDPQFWDVWTGKDTRSFAWNVIAKNW